jgi:hypothetical protein
MERMEELIRQSLQARAQDVEPTPALWLEVDRRVARRRRFQVVSWSLAGVAAAVLAVFAVPAVIGLFTGPDQLDIAPMDRTPAGGVVSTHALAVDADGEITILDLRTGATTPVSSIDRRPVEVGQLVLAPTSTPTTEPRWAAPHWAAAVTAGEHGCYAVGSGLHATTTCGWPEPLSVAISPDGAQAAYLQAQEEADGVSVVIARVKGEGLSGEQANGQDAVATIEAGSMLVEWRVGADESTQELWVLRPDGSLVALVLGASPEGLTLADTYQLAEGAVLDAASAAPDRSDAPRYLLRNGADGPELTWSPPSGAETTLPLAALVAETDPADLWLDAKQDAVLLGDGERTWLVAHDGRGQFGEPVELSEGVVRAALFQVARPGDTPDEATDEPATEPTEPETSEAEGPVVEGAPLPAPIVTVSLQDLVLHGPGGARTLYTLPTEGESTFISARVRPGSTMDDLTVVALVRAEGMLDLREYGWDGSELTWDYLPDHLQPGVGDTPDAGAQAHGPVWSPEGDKLAWFEFGTGAAPTLRVIGWTDDGPGTGEPATDNASFTIDTRGNVPLIPVEWVATPGGPSATEIRATGLDSNEGWYALPVDVQADGAVALGGDVVQVRNGPSGGTILGVASDDVASPRWLVQSTFDGAMLHEAGVESGTLRPTSLPAELLPGDGLVELWVRSIGDGALVGSRNTATAYYVEPDGTPNRIDGQVIDADVVR